MSLPKGWIEVPLKNVVEVFDAQRVPINNTERAHRITGKQESELYPYYGATGNTGYIDDYLFDEELVLLGEDGVPFFDPLKHKAYIISGKTWVNNHAHVLKAREYITLNSFLTYFLNQFDYHGYVNGATRLKLNQANMKKIPFILPPFNEQKRISKKLDELLTTVESIKTRLDNAPKIIKRFRQSILTAATSGKLTEEWREKNNLSNTWKNIDIGSLFSELQQGWSPKCENTPANDNEWGVIKTSSVQSIYFIEEENKKLPSSLNPRESLSLKKDDILITRASPRVRCAITCHIHKDFDNLMICDKVYRIRTDTKKALSKYIVYVLNSPKHLAELEKMKTGISESGLNLTQKKFKLMEIDIPDITEQKEIISQVEVLFLLANRLEEKIEAAKKRVDKLTQSILAKAFKGELVPQDPNDESGEELLKRIKVEQEKEKTKKTRKKVVNNKLLFDCSSIDNMGLLLVQEFYNKNFELSDISSISRCSEKEVMKLFYQLLKKKIFIVNQQEYKINNIWENDKQLFKIEKIKI